MEYTKRVLGDTGVLKTLIVERIMRERLHYGLSTRAVSKLLGIDNSSEPSWGMIEREPQLLTEKLAYAVLGIFGIEHSEILDVQPFLSSEKNLNWVLEKAQEADFRVQSDGQEIQLEPEALAHLFLRDRIFAELCCG
jgi:hypothetical protein